VYCVVFHLSHCGKDGCKGKGYRIVNRATHRPFLTFYKQTNTHRQTNERSGTTSILHQEDAYGNTLGKHIT